MRAKMIMAGAAVAALGLTSSLVGCSGGSTSGESKHTTIDWAFWDQGKSGNKMWKSLAKDVHKQHPDITVKPTMPDFADYFTKLQSQLAGGNPPCIVSMQSLRLPGFAKAMVPLGKLVKKDGFKSSEWKSPALKALQYKGKQYAIPYGFSTMLMYYNKDEFKKAGIDPPDNSWTVQEFEKDAKKLTDKTGKPGFGQSFSDLHMFSLLHAYDGAKPVSDSGQLQLTTDRMKSAFSWYSGLSTKEKVASTPSSASDVPWGEQQFTAGNVAMAVDGTWNLAQNSEDADFKMGVVNLPHGSNGPGDFSANSGFGISKQCDHKTQAAKAIASLTDNSAEKKIALDSDMPARKKSGSTYYSQLNKAVGTALSKEAHKAADSAQSVSTPFIATDNWDETTKTIAKNFILAYNGEISSSHALRKVQVKRGE